MITRDDFILITNEVIRLLEGGYYHPDMFLDGRIGASNYPVYANSGETMFGLDRYAGHGLYYSTKRIGNSVRDDLHYIYNGSYKYKSQQAQEFWSYMDRVNARKLWALGYKGGEKREQLTKLASSIIYDEFLNLSKRYLSDKSRIIVFSSPELIFNFSYLVWNGAGFFQHYSKLMNSAVSSGITDPKKLSDLLINNRINGPYYKLPRSGKVMIDFFKSPEFETLKKNLGRFNPFSGDLKPVGALGITLVLFGGYWALKRFLN